MTLADCYNTYKGQSVDIDGVQADAGQCVQWADLVLNQVYGLPYFYAPGAINWWTTPSGSLDNFDKISYSPSMSIKAGDFVIYGAGVGSVFGHIDVAAQDGVGNNYVGYDSNWGHNLTVHTVNHNDSYNQYILGVLRLKGTTTMPFFNNDTDRDNLINALMTGLYGPRTQQQLDSDLANLRPAFDADPRATLFAVLSNAAAASDSLQAQLNYSRTLEGQPQAPTKQSVLEYINEHLQ